MFRVAPDQEIEVVGELADEAIETLARLLLDHVDRTVEDDTPPAGT